MKTKKQIMEQFLKPHSNEYPYIVQRIAPAVYDVRQIRFVDEITAENSSKELLIEEKTPYENGKLTNSVKKTIVKITLDWSKQTNKKMCAVFGPQECVYCEPGGRLFLQTFIPSGGLILNNLKKHD